MASTTFTAGRLHGSHPAGYVLTRPDPAVRDRALGESAVGEGASGAGDLAARVADVLLADQDFERVDELVLTPKPRRRKATKDTTRARSLPAGAETGPINLDLDLDAGEGAVVLVEQDGCYSWHLPREAPSVTGVRTRSIGPRRVSFEVPLGQGADPSGRGRTRGIRSDEPSNRTRGLLGDLIAGAIRVTVLKFAAPALAGATIGFLERHVEPGLVVITDPDPATWSRAERLTDAGLGDTGSARILLLVHGTFSSTVGGFGVLGCTPAGRAWLDAALRTYDAVLGFDHPTLSVDPLANASDLLTRLKGWHGELTIDVICHSRGGLTTRSFVEQVLPASGWPGRVDRIVFVAATNAGTHLADEGRLSDLVDVMTNLAAVAAGGMAGLVGGPVPAAVLSQTMRSIGAVVKHLAAYLFTENGIPGLAAMRPGGPFVTELNGEQPGQPGPGVPWYVVESDFHVSLLDDSHRPPQFPRELAVRLTEGVLDRLFKGPNDLVVDVSSMGSIDAARGGFVADTLDFGTNDVVYHVNYFAQPELVEALGRWLLEPIVGRRRDRHLTMARPPEVTLPMLPSEVRGGGGSLEVDDGEPAESVGAEPESGAEAEPEGADTEPVNAHLLAEMAASPVVGTSTPVRVALSRRQITKLVDRGAAAGATFTARAERELTVQVVGKRNCKVVGADSDSFELPRGQGTSELGFEVRASQPGPVTVAIIVRDGDVPVAMLTLEAEAVATAGEGARGTARGKGVAEPVSDLDLEDAVWLEILQTEEEEATIFQYTVRAPSLGLLERFESPPLHDIEGHVIELYKELRQVHADHGSGPTFQAALQDTGAQLFDELFPEKLRALLWTNRRRLAQLVLLADEPYLPWELVHLKPPIGRRQKTPNFLGQLGLVRWQFTGFPRSTLRARQGRVRVLCPQYVDPGWVLPEAAQEAAFVTKELGATPVPATEREVGKLLRTGGFDLLHLSGHGMADPADIAAAKFMLAGLKRRGGAVTPQYLTATSVAQNAELRDSDGSGPLVVINACQTGRGGQQLSSLGGFARAFLQAGATAFVSTLWSVGDTPAHDFVETFYGQLIAGETVGVAARAAREAARKAGDATWLAYTVYARPDARLVRT